MAAQDLIISRRGPATSATYYDSDSNSPDSAGPDGAAVLLSTLHKRWLLLLIIGLVSALFAGLVAWQFAKDKVVVKAAVIYAGLPNLGANGAFTPLSAATGAEMITSVNVLNQLSVKRGLDITPTQLADHITTNVGRSSSLINVTLAWQNVEDGISILNDLTTIFIEEMATQRKAILAQHLRHLDLALLQAKGRVDESRSQLENLQTQKRQKLERGENSTSKYRNALVNADAVAAKLIDKHTDLIGTNKQIEQLSALIKEVETKDSALTNEVQQELLHELDEVFQKARSLYAANSAEARQIDETAASVKKLVLSPEGSKSFTDSLRKLVLALQSSSSKIAEENRKHLAEILAQAESKYNADHKNFEETRRGLEEKRSQLQLAMIPMTEQITSLKQQKATLDQQAEKIGEQISGVSATQLDEADHALEEAQKRQDGLADQSIVLRQLSETQQREWAVNVPASMATAQVSSNRLKLFVMVFGLCMFALSAPLFVAEWLAQNDSPQIQLARSLRVPILAERILEHFSPAARKASVNALEADQSETVRMLTLRIQQSCHRPGSIVLFSSLDANFSTVPLMASIADCLADREERVLIIDAVCPRRALMPVLNVLSSSELSALPKTAKKGPQVPLEQTTDSIAQSRETFGLSDYFADECDDISELVQPTARPGVDLIASGRDSFSREAMASSCLTELLNTCRKNYTMVLVHGPAADSAADLQMLTARADGVVLATTKSAGRNPQVRAIVQDLIDLGAPIIGLVA